MYTAIGHVHFEQGTRKADADHGVLNRGTGMLHLEGNVKTSDGDSKLTATNVDYNLFSKHVEANGKPVIIRQPVPTPEPGSASPTPKPKKTPPPHPHLARCGDGPSTRAWKHVPRTVLRVRTRASTQKRGGRAARAERRSP